MTDPAESTITRYRDAAIALLPPGRAFSKRPDSNIGKLLEGMCVEEARIHEAAADSYDAMFPGWIPDDYLAAWEQALDLPGACVENPPTSNEDRNGAIIAKLQGRASHSRGSFEAAALALGYEDLEFTTYNPFETGTSAVGDALYDDAWMYVVTIAVLTGDDTADESLVCALDELRRAHGYLEIILEGPMGATRTYTANYLNAESLSADITPTANIEVKYQGHLSIQCQIDNGAGVAPTDTPVGAWELWCSVDGSYYSQITDADVVAELALIAPNGNNVVEAWAVLNGVPGRYLQVRYNRTSGGGTDATVNMHLSTW